MIKSLSYISEFLPVLLLIFYSRIKDRFFLELFMYNLFIVISVAFIKKIIPRFFSGKDMFMRPKGACDCSLFGEGNEGDYAFPSGHTTSVTFICLSLYWYFNRAEWLILIPIVGFSRVYSLCHTTSQVVAGFVYGLIMFYLLTIKKIFYINK